jgi:copper oxidase (laccase) domain-containing protein
MQTSEEQLEARQAELLELEATLVRAIGAARYELQQAADELRRAKAEARRRQINIRTERQVADELQCSIETVARARKRYGVPHIAAGTHIRYTDEQFLLLIEALERPAKLRAVKESTRARSAS